MINTSQFIRINDRLLLDRNDSDFVRKYALYFPHDGNGLFDYAQELEANGRQKLADKYYALAEEKGSYKSRNRLDEIARSTHAQMTADRALAAKQLKEAARKKARNQRNAVIACALLLLFLAIFLLKDKAIFSPSDSSAMIGVESETTPVTETLNFNTPAIEEVLPAHTDGDIVYTANELTYLIALNAVVRFKEERGAYPESLDALTKQAPENWLTEIPTNVSYKTEYDSFLLYQDDIAKKLGVVPEEPATIDPYLFKLDFYPSSNELALMSGDKLLAVYPVAAGSEDMVFTASKASGKVLSRVVEPNGEGSELGSRGLSLANNYAIHGTNDPMSIGKNVTGGCLRMFNEDIDVLYPYVSKGTPFAVKADTETLDAKPMFEMGLPVLNPGAAPPVSEKTPNKVYSWKN